MDKFKAITKNTIEKLPKAIGVYLFYSENPLSRSSSGRENPVYIGKAINIKNRVKNHFQGKNWWEKTLLGQGFKGRVGFIETNSEIEALILEADLIKKYQPKFNVIWRDDKNYFFVAIAKNKDKIPYIFITHQIGKSKILNLKSKIEYIGPFVEGNSLKKTLKFLRRVFPFYTSTKHPRTQCTWCHLGLCPGPVRNSAPIGSLGARKRAGAISNGAGPSLNLKEYKKNIKRLMLVLQGKRKTVLYALKKEMNALSKEDKFEEALAIRDKMYALEQVMKHKRVISNEQPATSNYWDKTQKVLQDLTNSNKKISRIECYDISNIQGKQAVGSMVVFVNGVPDKRQYKKFRIRMKNEPNDIAMLKEVITRRLTHPEWGYPEAILIDGGIAQLNVAISTKNQYSVFSKALENTLYVKSIKIISIAKGKRELFIEGIQKPISLKKLPQEIYNLIVHLDDEAHRFAVTYHRKLRKKNLLE